jgi:hypothetical protein
MGVFCFAHWLKIDMARLLEIKLCIQTWSGDSTIPAWRDRIHPLLLLEYHKIIV